MKRSPLKADPEKVRAWQQRSRRPLKAKPMKRTRPETPLAYWCEARTSVCGGQAWHRHHLRLRSQGGTDGPTIDVCFPCHRYIHDHPAESYERGWLLRTEAS